MNEDKQYNRATVFFDAQHYKTIDYTEAEQTGSIIKFKTQEGNFISVNVDNVRYIEWSIRSPADRVSRW